MGRNDGDKYLKVVPLTKGKVAFVDDEDYEKVMQYRWQIQETISSTGVVGWYAATRRYTKKREKLRMHRLILDVKPGELVDHRDNNGLNNQRHNLRVATNQQNQWNRHGVYGLSKYKGVTYSPSQKMSPWRARIMGTKDNSTHLGYFRTEEEAARAYDRQARLVFGEFARLNFPDDREESKAA